MNPNIQNIAERKNAVGDISVEAKKTATTLANSSNIDNVRISPFSSIIVFNSL